MTFDRAASTYGRIGPDFFSHFGRRLVALVDVQPGTRILDAATGTGAALLPASERVGEGGQAVGVDLSSLMLSRLAGELRVRDVSNSDLVRADVERLPFANACFDYVLCGFALDSFPDPDTALSEFRRVIRRGEHLGLCVSSSWWFEDDERWRWLEDLLGEFGVSIHDRSVRLATTDDLEGALHLHGFADVILIEEEFPLTFADHDEWLRWGWSHGYRRLLEQLDAEQLDLYRAVSARKLGDGRIEARLKTFLVRALAG